MVQQSNIRFIACSRAAKQSIQSKKSVCPYSQYTHRRRERTDTAVLLSLHRCSPHARCLQKRIQARQGTLRQAALECEISKGTEQVADIGRFFQLAEKYSKTYRGRTTILSTNRFKKSLCIAQKRSAVKSMPLLLSILHTSEQSVSP